MMIIMKKIKFLTYQKIFISSLVRNSRILFCGTLFLMILIAPISGYEENLTNNSGLSSSQSSGNLIPSYPFITIELIPDHYIGDTFFINGTTNLPPTTNLTVETISGIFHALGKQQPGQYVGRTVSATITEKSGGVNTWVAIIDTSGYNRTATQYNWIVVVTPQIFDSPENLKYQNLSTFIFLKGQRPVRSVLSPETTMTVPTEIYHRQKMAETSILTRSPLPVENILIAICLFICAHACLYKK